MSDEAESGGLTLGERIRKIEADAEATRSIVTDIASRDRADLVRIQLLERDVGKKAEQSVVTALTNRVSALEASLTWAWRTVVGALAVAGVGLLVRLAG